MLVKKVLNGSVSITTGWLNSTLLATGAVTTYIQFAALSNVTAR